MTDPRKIAQALRAPEANVVANWPLIEAAFSALGVNSLLALQAAAATVAVECPSFTPQAEKYNGNPEEYFRKYDGRPDLGNTRPGDGYQFRGRGFIQLTGRANYAAFSRVTGEDIVTHPDNALIPSVSARILAWFFVTRGAVEAANARDWRRIRSIVNGGSNGWTMFLAAISNLDNLF